MDSIAAALGTESSYAAYEMSVAKSEFERWKVPVLPDGYSIEGYSHDDLAEYVSILEEAMDHVRNGYFSDRKSEYAQAWSHDSKDNHFYSLKLGSQCVGLCHGERFEVERLAVREAHRRKGCGYALLCRMLASMFAVTDGVASLYVVESNCAAREFYGHAGMSVTGHSARFTVEPSLIGGTFGRRNDDTGDTGI